jgi:hypothetical protein
MGLQSCRNPSFGNFKTPIWESRDKNGIWVLVSWLGTKYTIRGEGDSFPQIRAMVSLVSPFAHGLSVHQKCSSYALINLLFKLCRFMWVIELLITLPSPHPGALACPFTSKVLRAEERAPTPPFVVFTFRLTMNPSRSLGVCHLCFFVILKTWLWITT